MNPFFVTDFSISDSLKTVRKSVLIYETIILILHGLVIHPEKLPRISSGLINVSILGLIIRPLKIMSAKPMPIHITMILKNLLHFRKSIKNLQMLLILKKDMLI